MFIIAAPDGIDRSFFQYGRRVVKRAPGYIAKRDKKNDWCLVPALKYAHKWTRREKAESAALLMPAFLPDLAGRMEIVEVERLSKGAWRRVRS